MKIIDRCDVCRVAVNDGEFQYIVPLNFGTEVKDGTLYLYFHSAMEGKKVDLFGRNSKVTFEMDCEHDIILYEEHMSCTMGYASVIGHGIMEKLTDEEKYDALKKLMKHYHSEEFAFNTDMMKGTNVYRMTVLDLTGKRRGNGHSEEKQTHITME